MIPRMIDRLCKLDELVINKNTGTPLELSKKLKISERSARGYIKLLKMLGAPIVFDRKYKSYCYQEDGFFNFRFIKFDDLTKDNPNYYQYILRA